MRHVHLLADFGVDRSKGLFMANIFTCFHDFSKANNSKTAAAISLKLRLLPELLKNYKPAKPLQQHGEKSDLSKFRRAPCIVCIEATMNK